MEEFLHAGMALQFSPDGRRLAVVTDKQKLRLLEAPRSFAFFAATTAKKQNPCNSSPAILLTSMKGNL